MLILITYDINTETDTGKKRLRRVAKACVNYGQRVQNSVFECLLDPVQLLRLRREIERIIDPKLDSIRYYNLGDHYQSRIEHVGAHETYDPEEPLIL